MAFNSETTENLKVLIWSRFLLPALQIRHVLEQTTIHASQEALKTMPKILVEAFQATLNRIESQPESRKKQAWTALIWVYLTERQLEVNELCHALAIRPGDTFFDEEGLPTSKSLLDFCFGLIIIDDGKSVRLVHKSLQDFFDKHYKSEFFFAMATKR
jgi:hypothetical protein